MNSREQGRMVGLVAALLAGPRGERLLRAARLVAALTSAHDLRNPGPWQHELGSVERRRLRAAMALGSLCQAGPRGSVMAGPAEVAKEALRHITDPRRETFVCLVLDIKNRVRLARVVARGSVDQCPVDPRRVFEPALRAHGSAVAVAHNHPSGDLEPSVEDVALTRRLEVAGQGLGLPLLDHVIVAADGRYLSLAARGVMRVAG